MPSEKLCVHTHAIRHWLQYISDICALDNFITSRKPEVHPIIYQCFLLFFFKNVTLQILNFLSVS